MTQRKRRTHEPMGDRINNALMKVFGPAQIGPYRPADEDKPIVDVTCEHCGQPMSTHIIVHEQSRPGYVECPGPAGGSIHLGRT